MNNSGNDMFLIIFDLMNMYPRNTEDTLRQKRIERRKDDTFLIWHGTQSLMLFLGTVYLEHYHAIEGDSSILNDIHETYSRMLSLLG